MTQLAIGFVLAALFGVSIQAPVSEDSFWYTGCGVSKYADAGREQPLPIKQKKSTTGEFIVNGWNAREGEFPWQAGLRRFGSHTCGAVIIDANHLLTAAHCTENTSPSSLTVVVGDHRRSQSNPSRATYQIARLVSHEDFDETGEIENDIAILRTQTRMTFSENVLPACKPSGNYGRMTGTTSGWGRVGDFFPLADVLQYANNPVMEHSDCDSCFPRPTDILPGMVCFGICTGDSNRQSTCNGDSGGPLVVKNAGNTWDIVGLTSFGVGGCLSTYPPVFANVSYYTEWVDDKLPVLLD